MVVLAGPGTQCRKIGPRERTLSWGLGPDGVGGPNGERWTEPAEEPGSEPELEKAGRGRRFDVEVVPTDHPDAGAEGHSLG